MARRDSCSHASKALISALTTCAIILTISFSDIAWGSAAGLTVEGGYAMTSLLPNPTIAGRVSRRTVLKSAAGVAGAAGVGAAVPLIAMSAPAPVTTRMDMTQF